MRRKRIWVDPEFEEFFNNFKKEKEFRLRIRLSEPKASILLLDEIKILKRARLSKEENNGGFLSL